MESHSPFGSYLARFMGYVVDNVLMNIAVFAGSFFGGVVAAVMAGPETQSELIRESARQGATLGLFFWGGVAWFLNFGVIQGLTGASIGKHLFGIRVVNADGSPLGMGRSMMRALCYVISALPFYLGFAAIFWSDRKQCWHDSLCGTVVIRKGAVYPVPEPVAPTFPSSASSDGGGDGFAKAA